MKNSKAKFAKRHLDLLTIIVLFICIGLFNFIFLYTSFSYVVDTSNILLVIFIIIASVFFSFFLYLYLVFKLINEESREKFVKYIKKREDKAEQTGIKKKLKVEHNGMLSVSNTTDHEGKLSHPEEDGKLSIKNEDKEE